MSPRKRFEYLLLAIEVGTSRKYRRMKPQERWCTVAGVFSIAAKSPISGALLVAYGHEATEQDVAEQAGVSAAVARSTLDALRDLHELVRDDVLGAWVIEDWSSHQPEPRGPKPSDDPEATRVRKRRQRERDGADVTPNGHADVTRVTLPDVTPPEEKRSKENTPKAPVTGGGEGAATDLEAARERLQAAAVQRVFDTWLAAKTQHSGRQSTAKLDDKRRRIIRKALKDFPLADVLDAARGWLHSPHHRGENERHTVYNDLELVLRDAAHIERFRDLERHGAAKPTDPHAAVKAKLLGGTS